MFMEFKSCEPAPAPAGTQGLRAIHSTLKIFFVQYQIPRINFCRFSDKHVAVSQHPLHSVLRHQSDVTLVTGSRMKTNPSNMIMLPETEILTHKLQTCP